MNKEKFYNMVREHELWLKSKGTDGKQLKLKNKCLKYITLKKSNLTKATLYNINFESSTFKFVSFKEASLHKSNFKNSMITNVNFSNANLRKTNFKQATINYNSAFNCADLSRSNFRYASIRDCNFSNAELDCSDCNSIVIKNSNFSNANLFDANFVKAGIVNSNFKESKLHDTIFTRARIGNTNFKEAKTNHTTTGLYSSCPEEGSFIGFKKANGCLVKLKILSDARRSSATGYKCRCDKAKVLKITDLKTGEEVKEIASNFDISFIYKVGKIVEEPNYNENKWEECAEGIHFFLNKDLAKKW